MTQKKKINLSPLPQQTDDYSRYEETVTRWDRIVAVAVVFVVVIAVFAYLMLSDSDSADSVQSPRSMPMEAQEQIAEQQTSALNNETTVPSDKSKQLVASVEEIEPAISDEKNTVLTSEVISKTNEVDAGLPEQHASTVTSSEVSQQTLQNAKPKELIVKHEEAVVGVVNKSITKAVLTLDLDENKPQEPIPYDLALPEEGIVKVILYTEMQGLKGKTLFHDWYRNGVRQARVKIPVLRNTQSSYSSKFINAQMLGEWQVKVLDSKAASYIEADFRVVAP